MRYPEAFHKEPVRCCALSVTSVKEPALNRMDDVAGTGVVVRGPFAALAKQGLELFQSL
jgi:hypothetical protein